MKTPSLYPTSLPKRHDHDVNSEYGSAVAEPYGSFKKILSDVETVERLGMCVYGFGESTILALTTTCANGKKLREAP